MTTVVGLSNFSELVVAVAAIEFGALPRAEVVFLVGDLTEAPEARPGLTSLAEFDVARSVVRQVLSLNELVWPQHPRGWRLGEAIGEGFVARLLERLDDGRIDRLVVPVPTRAPWSVLARAIDSVPVTVLSASLDAYLPPEDSFGGRLGERIDGLIHADLLPGVTTRQIGGGSLEYMPIPRAALSAACRAMTASAGHQDAVLVVPPPSWAYPPRLEDIAVVEGAIGVAAEWSGSATMVLSRAFPIDANVPLSSAELVEDVGADLQIARMLPRAVVSDDTDSLVFAYSLGVDVVPVGLVAGLGVSGASDRQRMRAFLAARVIAGAESQRHQTEIIRDALVATADGSRSRIDIRARGVWTLLGAARSRSRAQLLHGGSRRRLVVRLLSLMKRSAARRMKLGERRRDPGAPQDLADWSGRSLGGHRGGESSSELS